MLLFLRVAQALWRARYYILVLTAMGVATQFNPSDAMNQMAETLVKFSYLFIVILFLVMIIMVIRRYWNIKKQ
ncbi:MAG: hypothetical protein RBU29_00880 [bacterium]|jgi:hypothetical protein|nr:hypothetical protein [bacterium]